MTCHTKLRVISIDNNTYCRYPLLSPYFVSLNFIPDMGFAYGTAFHRRCSKYINLYTANLAYIFIKPSFTKAHPMVERRLFASPYFWGRGAYFYFGTI
jgi:hypothetical protein